MFKKTIKYTDFLGNEQKEDFRFNISESEMLDIASKDPMFNPDYLRYILAEGRGLEMVDMLRKLIVISYGELSDDGKKFRKSDERTLDFVQSAAYDALFEELIGGANEDAVKEFFLGIFPAKFASTVTDEKIANVLADARK